MIIDVLLVSLPTSTVKKPSTLIPEIDLDGHRHLKIDHLPDQRTGRELFLNPLREAITEPILKAMGGRGRPGASPW